MGAVPDEPTSFDKLKNRMSANGESDVSTPIVNGESDVGHNLFSKAAETETTYYQRKDHVLLRMETMTFKQVRVLNFCMWTFLWLAFLSLLWLFTEKLIDGLVAVQQLRFAWANVAVGSFCLVGVTIALIAQCVRLYCNRSKYWTRSRSQFTVFVTVELCAQWLNLVFYVIPNYYLVSSSCPQINPQLTSVAEMIRWSCWAVIQWGAVMQAHNTNLWHRRDASRIKADADSLEENEHPEKPILVGDLPFLRAHWWKLLVWALTEVGVVAFAAFLLVEKNQPLNVSRPCDGRKIGEGCEIGLAGILLTVPLVTFPLVCFGLFSLYLFRGLRQQRYKSRMSLRLADTIVRIQLRLRFPAFTFFMLSIVLMFYVKPLSCTSVFTTWLGMLPGHISVSVLVICIAYVGAPQVSNAHSRPPMLQVWLQEFAWLEEDVDRFLTSRTASMAAEDLEHISREPIFCAESMLKCLSWSWLVYDYKELTPGAIQLEEACSMFNPPLTEHELYWEKGLDTKCLLAWNPQSIMLSFRGTASMSNVFSDLKAWHTYHWPRRGTWWSHPRVHNGFAKAYLHNGLHRKILEKIESLLNSGAVQKGARLFVTGHSLGGSLCTLASYDLASLPAIQNGNVRVTCMSFGAPRTGNRRFSKDFQEMVPDSWNIINGQDIFGRGFKFLWFYKRGGHRVILNKKGDLIVRPSPLEASLRLQPFSQSLKAHLLSSYLRSIAAAVMREYSHGSTSDRSSLLELIDRNKLLKDTMSSVSKNFMRRLREARGPS